MKEWKVHVVVWVAWILIHSLCYPFQGPSLALYVLSPLSLFGGYMFAFYLTIYIFRKYWDRMKIVTIAFIPVIYVIYIGFFRIYTYFYLLPSVDPNFVFITYKEVTPTMFALRSTLWWSHITLSALGYFFAKHSIKKLKNQNLLEKELLETEAKLIKSQLNPHFLFNVLNFMFDESRQFSDRLANSITLLAEIMRYSLSTKSISEKVNLSDELYHIKNFVKLNDIRFNDQLSVCIQVCGNVDQKKVIPFVLINYVENAFKHGLVSDDSCPIKIKLEVEEELILFFVENKKNQSATMISHGVGNENVRRRMDHVYGDQYSIDIQDDSEYYRCNIRIYD